MTKTLTNSAKIHLATRVDSYVDDSYGAFIKEDEHVEFRLYNPNQLDTCPFAGKYLRDLWKSIIEKKLWDSVTKELQEEGNSNSMLNGLTFSLRDTDKVIKAILKATGFDIKGAWEK